jgi:hypothetical protein
MLKSLLRQRRLGVKRLIMADRLEISEVVKDGLGSNGLVGRLESGFEKLANKSEVDVLNALPLFFFF